MQDVQQLSDAELLALIGPQAPAPRPTPSPRPSDRQGAMRPALPAGEPAPAPMAMDGLSDLGQSITGDDTPEQIAAKLRASGVPEAEIASIIGDFGGAAADVDPALSVMTNEELLALAGGAGEAATDGIKDFEALTLDERLALNTGDRVRIPNGEVVTLRGRPFVDEQQRASDRSPVPGLYLREPNLEDSAEAFATAASEQLPGMDEAVAAVGGLLTGRGFDATRQSQMLNRELLNQTNPVARDVGGIVGAVAPALLPIGAAANFVGRGATLGGLTGRGARAAAVAAPVGAVMGFGNTDGDFGERAQASAVSGLLSAAAAPVGVAAVEGVSALAPRIAAGGQEAFNRIGGLFGREAPEVEITPRATDSAVEYVQGLLQRSGADLANNPVAAMGKPITAAEAIGPTGIAQVAGLTRRTGRTAGAATDQLRQRMTESQRRIVDDFAGVSGINPDGAYDTQRAIAASARARAAPLYDQVRGMQVQPSPLLEDILSRPVGRSALRRAYMIARNEGVNPEEIGMTIRTRDEGLTTGPSRATKDPELFADLDAMREGRKVSGDGRGETLLQFISRNGGVRDDGGELAQIGADTWNRQGAFRNRAVRSDGLTLEQMADRARSAGFFDDVADAAADSADNYQRISPQDMINAIDDELRGNARFARTAGDTDRSAAAVARRARRDALDERLNREGLDISKMSNAEIARALDEADDTIARAMAQLDGEGPGQPMVDLLPGMTPTMQTLDYVKRGMNDVIEGYRDGTTGRLNLDDQGRAVVNATSQFRDELVRLTGGDEGVYAQALKVSGDAIRIDEAFKLAPRLIGQSVRTRDFVDRVERMGEAERQALAAGVADHILGQMERGRLTPRQLDNVQFREKISALVGTGRAAEFIQRLRAEMGMAQAGARMAPGSGSVTAEAMQAMREQDGAGTFGGILARNIERGPSIAGLLSAGGEMLGTPVAGFARGFSSPQPTAVRDEMGRLLMMSPDELDRVLRASQGGILRPRQRPVSGSTGVASGLLAAQTVN